MVPPLNKRTDTPFRKKSPPSRYVPEKSYVLLGKRIRLAMIQKTAGGWEFSQPPLWFSNIFMPAPIFFVVSSVPHSIFY